jgi:TM2 domain-containing membrane protein YozV
MEDETKGPQQHEVDGEDDFLRERMERYGQRRQAPFDPFLSPRPRKSKWLAGLLSFMIPGTGQFYLGLMQRGLGIMLLFFLDIFAIVFFATNGADSIPLIVLFALLVPVIYFYNIFDALQQTDKVNNDEITGYYGGPSMEAGLSSDSRPARRRSKGNAFGYLLIAAGAVLFLASGKPAWLERAFELLGSSIGAVILIGVGLIMFYKESRKK